MPLFWISWVNHLFIYAALFLGLFNATSQEYKGEQGVVEVETTTTTSTTILYFTLLLTN